MTRGEAAESDSLVASLSFLIRRLSWYGYSTGQLQDLRRLLFALKLFLRAFREGFWKMLRLPGDLDSLVVLLLQPWFDESEEECTLEHAIWGLFSAWFMRASHFAAGSLSSITRTFPALRGTIS